MNRGSPHPISRENGDELDTLETFNSIQIWNGARSLELNSRGVVRDRGNLPLTSITIDVDSTDFTTPAHDFRSNRSASPTQQQDNNSTNDAHHVRFCRSGKRMGDMTYLCSSNAEEEPVSSPGPDRTKRRAVCGPDPASHPATPIGTTGGFSSSQQRRTSSRAVVACICRDSFGRIRDGFAKNVEVSSVEQAEVVALVETLDFISSKIIPNSPEKEIVLLSDCRMLVESVLSSSTLS